MSFEDLKRDLTSGSYFNHTDDKKEIIRALNEKQFLSHLNDILLVFDDTKYKERLITILKMRYGVLESKEYTLLEISKVFNVDVESVSSDLFNIRNACIFYYYKIRCDQNGDVSPWQD